MMMMMMKDHCVDDLERLRTAIAQSVSKCMPHTEPITKHKNLTGMVPSILFKRLVQGQGRQH